MNKLFTEREKLNKEIQELDEDIFKMKNDKKENQTKQDPIIQSRRDEYMGKIDELKEKKKQIRQKHNEDWDKYKEEQRLVRKVEIMTKIKQ